MHIVLLSETVRQKTLSCVAQGHHFDVIFAVFTPKAVDRATKLSLMLGEVSIQSLNNHDTNAYLEIVYDECNDDETVLVVLPRKVVAAIVSKLKGKQVPLSSKHARYAVLEIVRGRYEEPLFKVKK